MKLINREILLEYGFIPSNTDSKNGDVIMSKDKIDIVIKSDTSVWYSNMGFDYPLRDLTALKKLYKEIRNKDLIAV